MTAEFHIIEQQVLAAAAAAATRCQRPVAAARSKAELHIATAGTQNKITFIHRRDPRKSLIVILFII
jgi:hypothetical protein